MKNFEIKLNIDNVDQMMSIIEKTGAIRKDDLHQIDYYLNVGTFKEKIREIEGEEIQIITYNRFEKAGRKESRYNIKQITIDEKNNILSKRKILCTVDKVRRLWIYKHTRIHLDSVSRLGSFLELETVIKDISAIKGLAEFKEILDILQLDPQKAIIGSYSDLMIDSQKIHHSSYLINSFANC